MHLTRILQISKIPLWFVLVHRIPGIAPIQLFDSSFDRWGCNLLKLFSQSSCIAMFQQTVCIFTRPLKNLQIFLWSKEYLQFAAISMDKVRSDLIQGPWPTQRPFLRTLRVLMSCLVKNEWPFASYTSHSMGLYGPDLYTTVNWKETVQYMHCSYSRASSWHWVL